MNANLKPGMKIQSNYSKRAGVIIEVSRSGLHVTVEREDGAIVEWKAKSVTILADDALIADSLIESAIEARLLDILFPEEVEAEEAAAAETPAMDADDTNIDAAAQTVVELECSANFTERNFAPSKYEDSTGRELPIYLIARVGIFLWIGLCRFLFKRLPDHALGGCRSGTARRHPLAYTERRIQ